MKKTELIEMIRTVVREEINSSLPQFLMEVLAEKISNQTVLTEKHSIESKIQSDNHVKIVEPKQKPVQAQPQRIFSNNPILNQVLNETTGGVPQEATIQSSVDILQQMTPQQLNENKEVAAVANALKKDYRSLLKAMDKKISEKRR
jgi:hypothetical protein